MDVKNTQSLNINTNNITQHTNSEASSSKNNVKFADELKNIEKKEIKSSTNKENTDIETKDKKDSVEETAESNKPDITAENSNNTDTKKIAEADDAIDGLQDIVTEINKLTQKDEIEENQLKQIKLNDDNNNKLSLEENYETNHNDKQTADEKEDNDLIENNINIQEPQEKKLETNTGTNMSFNSNGQQFTEFINNEKNQDVLNSSEKDLAEEKAILSTMEENVAIARKNILLKEKNSNNLQQKMVQNTEQTDKNEQKTITVDNQEGIKKVDKKTNLTVDTIVKYDNIVMNEADVDFFVNLVENGSINMKEIQNAEKSSQVSKTLADLLAKSMNENKPIRIDFDNDISVIIKIDRAGKISADFLPSSQIAEAYLKENLPLLRQRFDDNNINYNELNQRRQKQDTQDNRKKGRKDE